MDKNQIKIYNNEKENRIEELGYREEIDTERFDRSDLQKMQNIMRKYGIYRREDGYRELTEKFFPIIPDAYLGKLRNCNIYFTTAALYVLLEDETLVEMGYEDLLWDQFSYEKIDGNYVIRICDSEGNSAVYCGKQKEAENFYSLLFELKETKTSGDDEYYQITWGDDNVILKYMKILIDFHVLGNHDTVAPMIKCGEICYGLSEKEPLKNMYQYARSVQEISMEELKEEVLEFESMLDADEKRLRLALLCKDLVETLQITVCDVHPMNQKESTFINWMEDRIGIKNKENFIDMLTLPYALMTNKNNKYMDYEKIAEIVLYAYDEQMDIPWHILNNEKIGLWDHLKYLTEEYLSNEKMEEMQAMLGLCEFYALSGFYVSFSEFMFDGLYEELFDERLQNEFIGFIVRRNLQKYEIEIFDLYDLLNNESWNQLLDQYAYDDDRRTLGDKIFDFFYDEEVKA